MNCVMPLPLAAMGKKIRIFSVEVNRGLQARPTNRGLEPGLGIGTLRTA